MINTTISNQFLGAVKFMTNVMAVYRIKTHVISHWMFIQEYTPETILALAVVSSDWVKTYVFRHKVSSDLTENMIQNFHYIWKGVFTNAVIKDK